MEANELMLDDFVYMRLSNTEKWHIDKVKSLNNNGLLEYKPIPLTKDILLMNGLLFNEYWDEYDLNLDKNTYLSIECGINEKYYITISSYSKPIMLKYVHELQHLFRMCGLNELANNFKVE